MKQSQNLTNLYIYIYINPVGAVLDAADGIMEDLRLEDHTAQDAFQAQAMRLASGRRGRERWSPFGSNLRSNRSRIEGLKRTPRTNEMIGRWDSAEDSMIPHPKNKYSRYEWITGSLGAESV